MRLVFCWAFAGSKLVLNVFTFPNFPPARVLVSETLTYDLACFVFFAKTEERKKRILSYLSLPRIKECFTAQTWN